VRGQRNQRPTVLEALALKVPSDGPRVDHTAVSPWEVPNWVARTRYMGVVAPYVRKAWTRDLMASCEGMSIMITHTAAAIVSRRCGDLIVVGRAAATFSVGGSRPKVLAWSAGGNLTQFDADTYALARTAEEITHTYTDEVPPPDNIFIFSNLALALQAVQNPHSIKAHSSALRFHRALTTLTLRHSHVAYYLVWSPADGDLEGFRMASTWAAAGCLHDPPNGLGRIQSAAFQKDRARACAFLNWEIDFHWERCISDFRAAVTGHPTNGHAHMHVILEGPSTHHHPLWSAAVDMEKDAQGKKTKRPLYSRRTTSTALQLAVDHAFTGSYAQRFRPADPPETLSCPCGAPLRTPQHITRECPLFYQTRVNHAIHTHGRTISYTALYNSHPHKLLSFLRDSRAASRPPDFGPPVEVAPEPD
jgi:hypothetical protein